MTSSQYGAQKLFILDPTLAESGFIASHYKSYIKFFKPNNVKAHANVMVLSEITMHGTPKGSKPQ